MPASMMMAVSAGRLKVSGSSSAMPASGPRPGSTPTMVPQKQPIKHQRRLFGVSATAETVDQLADALHRAASERQDAGRQADAEETREDQPGDGRCRERRTAAHRTSE